MNSTMLLDKKNRDYEFSVKKETPSIHDFYVKDKLIGQLSKAGKDHWSAMSCNTPNDLCPVHGFRSRNDAASFLLTVCGFTEKEQSQKNSVTQVTEKIRIVSMTNENGVILDQEEGKHAKCVNAVCACGASLLLAPSILNPQHKKGNPIIVCNDHCIHAYWFKNLTQGKQAKACRTDDFE